MLNNINSLNAQLQLRNVRLYHIRQHLRKVALDSLYVTSHTCIELKVSMRSHLASNLRRASTYSGMVHIAITNLIHP
jgi:hypothetical protein